LGALGLNNIIVDHSARRDVEAAILHRPGQHLIFVRYSRDYDLQNEWVWNGADIDEPRIIWAQQDGPDSIGNVNPYWPDRTIWAVYPDTSPPRLEQVAVKEDSRK
jgi:hypothetical protein